MEQLTKQDELITLIYFNQNTRCIQYNPNIPRLESNGLFIDNDSTVYRIVFYNHKARVALAVLREESCGTD